MNLPNLISPPARHVHHRLKLCFCLLAIMLAAIISGHAQSGIVIWKEQSFHRDSTATAAIYSRSKLLGPVTQFYINGQAKSFNESQFYRNIDFLNTAMVKFTEEAEYNSLKRSYQELLAFSNQYPKATPLLTERLQRMEAIIKGFDEGKVFYDGKWMARGEYEKLYIEKQEGIAAQQAQLVKEENKKSATILIGAGVFILLLIVMMILRKWTWVGLLLIIPLAGAAWLTYQVGNHSWTKEIPKYLKVPESMQPFIEKCRDTFDSLK